MRPRMTAFVAYTAVLPGGVTPGVVGGMPVYIV